MLKIKPASTSEIESTAAAHLLEVAMSGSATLAYGAAAEQTLKSLYNDAGTLQSFSRTKFAWLDNIPVGLVIAIPAAEYHARLEITRNKLRQTAWPAWLRYQALELRRFIYRIPSGPGKGSQLHIESVAVHIQHRRCGIGTKLLTHTIGKAQTTGCTMISTDVSVSNTASRALMQSIGFNVHRKKNGQLKLINSLPYSEKRK